MKKVTHWFRVMTVAAAIFLPAICIAAPPIPTLKIVDYKQGLLRFDANSAPSIYEEGRTFKFQNNGICNVSGDMKPCVWHGFAFRFESTELNPLINCVSLTSSPRDMVSPRGTSEKQVKEARWSFVIPGKSGYYVRPQYTIVRPTIEFFSDISTCFYQGVEVLKIEINFTQPQ